MKKIITIMIIFISFGICGCGHKSEAEITDIEQFRCQDSIQTVFDVLGETELKTTIMGAEYYSYENLNLWGYEGEAVFYVRDNKDTIQDFDCNLVLNKKEFENILLQFEGKYGDYESKEFAGDTIYTWNIAEDKAEGIGYNEISITDCGDKKYRISFSDEWSIIKDEAYYEHLEKEQEVSILAQKTYNIGEDTFDFSFGQRGNGEYSFTLLCQVEDKSDAYMTHISLNALFNSDEESIKALTETMNFSYSIIIGDGTLLLRSKDMLYLVNDKEVVDVNDYFSVDWILSDERKESDYGEQVISFLVDFIQNE